MPRITPLCCQFFFKNSVKTDFEVKKLFRFEQNTFKIDHIFRLGKSKSVVLAIKGEVLPEKVFYEWHAFRIHMYIPRPIRCFKCVKVWSSLVIALRQSVEYAVILMVLRTVPLKYLATGSYF